MDPVTKQPLIDTWYIPPREAIERLSMVGLADAFTWARVRGELSEGQRHRFDLAVALFGDADYVAIDDFTSTLDRPTAKALAWTVHKAARITGKTILLATTAQDLEADLRPDLQIVTAWHTEPTYITECPTRPECTVLEELTYRQGTMADWRPLKPLHYLAGDPATIHSVHVMEHPDLSAPAAVALFSWPELNSAVRALITGKAYAMPNKQHAAARVNREIVKLSRIVVTPELRGLGIAQRLVYKAIEAIMPRWVECSTTMGPYTSFLSSIGFRELPANPSDPEARLIDYLTSLDVQPRDATSGALLSDWIDALSVRQRRHARRLVWRFFHHFVLNRRTHAKPPKNVPNPTCTGWTNAMDLAATRVFGRPVYYLMGPIDPMTGQPDNDWDEEAATDQPEELHSWTQSARTA